MSLDLRHQLRSSPIAASDASHTRLAVDSAGAYLVDHTSTVLPIGGGDALTRVFFVSADAAHMAPTGRSDAPFTSVTAALTAAGALGGHVTIFVEASTSPYAETVFVTSMSPALQSVRIVGLTPGVVLRNLNWDFSPGTPVVQLQDLTLAADSFTQFVTTSTVRMERVTCNVAVTFGGSAEVHMVDCEVTVRLSMLGPVHAARTTFQSGVTVGDATLDDCRVLGPFDVQFTATLRNFRGSLGTGGLTASLGGAVLYADRTSMARILAQGGTGVVPIATPSDWTIRPSLLREFGDGAGDRDLSSLIPIEGRGPLVCRNMTVSVAIPLSCPLIVTGRLTIAAGGSFYVDGQAATGSTPGGVDNDLWFPGGAGGSGNAGAGDSVHGVFTSSPPPSEGRGGAGGEDAGASPGGPGGALSDGFYKPSLYSLLSMRPRDSLSDATGCGGGAGGGAGSTGAGTEGAGGGGGGGMLIVAQELVIAPGVAIAFSAQGGAGGDAAGNAGGGGGGGGGWIGLLLGGSNRDSLALIASCDVGGGAGGSAAGGGQPGQAGVAGTVLIQEL